MCVWVGKILETLQAPVDDQSYVKCINMGSGLRYVPSSVWFILNWQMLFRHCNSKCMIQINNDGINNKVEFIA